MPRGYGVEGDRTGICRTSPVEFLLLTERIVREARSAQAVAIAGAVVRAFVAALRGVRLLPSIFRDAFALRDTSMPARQRGRTHHPNHHQ
jgi:hypothetical protein